MKVIDLSHPLELGMAVYPGAPEPEFAQIGDVAAGDTYQLIKFTMTTHTGTHMDCNTHVCSNEKGFTTDSKDVGFFMGKGLVLDCTKYANNTEIGMEVFENVNLDGVEFLFLYCDWAKKWGSKEFWSDYPYISVEVAKFLADHKTIRSLGVEYATIDPVENTDLPLHKIFLSEEKMVIENLTNLDKLIGKDFTYAGFPLKFKNGEGSPIRPVAILN